MSDRDAERPGVYALVPAQSVSNDKLLAFAASVLPETSPERMLQSWWRRADPSLAVAALHQGTRTIAGLCVGRPSTWMIEGNSCPAVAICSWYVAPDHGGRLIGRRLVRHFEAPDRLMYAYSLSDDAIRYLSRLGWVGPYASSLYALPLPRAARMVHALLRRERDVTFAEYEVQAPAMPEPLGADLERIAAVTEHGPYAHMRRGRDEWAWRLSVCGPRSYWFCVASRSGKPVGYIAARRMTPGSSRILGKREGAMITDLVAPENDPGVARALVAKAVSFAGDLRAFVVLAATTIPTHDACYAALGFLSPRFPAIGRRLAGSAPQFMWLPRGPGAHLTADRMALSFSDSDVDLNL
ncbi:MAG: GNAT family N-acetyltransferase [Methyloceanibacter sp.]|uniref:GNAT family N-acetyltransferase n=1 Tax=Methyloceanibacter sp. TaxID=1965321 RepID=UPI003D6C9FED